MPSVDEILAALPDVGLRLWLLGETSEGWYAVLHEPTSPAKQYNGNGATAQDALARALEDAVVKVDG